MIHIEWSANRLLCAACALLFYIAVRQQKRIENLETKKAETAG